MIERFPYARQRGFGDVASGAASVTSAITAVTAPVTAATGLLNVLGGGSGTGTGGTASVDDILKPAFQLAKTTVVPLVRMLQDLYDPNHQFGSHAGGPGSYKGGPMSPGMTDAKQAVALLDAVGPTTSKMTATSTANTAMSLLQKAQGELTSEITAAKNNLAAGRPPTEGSGAPGAVPKVPLTTTLKKPTVLIPVILGTGALGYILYRSMGKRGRRRSRR